MYVDMWIVSLHGATDLVCSRGAEASLAALCAVQRLQDLQLGVGDLLTDQLGDSVSLLHHKLCVRVVEHHDTDIAPVVLVHHPGPDVDVLLPGEAGPRSHPAVCAVRDADLEISLDETLPSRRDGGVLSAVEIIASSKRTAPGRECGVLSQLGNLQFAVIKFEFLGGGWNNCGGSFGHRHGVR